MGAVTKPFIHSLVNQQNYCDPGHRCSTVSKVAMEEALWQVAPDAGVVASASLMGGSFTKMLETLGNFVETREMTHPEWFWGFKF